MIDALLAASSSANSIEFTSNSQLLEVNLLAYIHVGKEKFCYLAVLNKKFNAVSVRLAPLNRARIKTNRY